MTQQDALYRAVCEHPDEDVPRLIFADHLEERGEARQAAFIRTQVRLARVSEHDSFWAECRRRDPDAIRGWTMAHTLPVLPPGVSWRRFRFKRGFPWLASVTLLGDLLQHGERLFERAPIQALELSHECGTDEHWNRFTEWPHLANLTRLEFTGTHLGADAIRRLCRSPFAIHLNELVFDSHAILSDGLDELAKSELFTRLHRLELRQAALAPALATGPLVSAPPGLRELALVDCKFPGMDVAWLLNHPFAQRLTALDLGENPIRADGVAAIRDGCPELESLRLRRTSLGMDGVRGMMAAKSGLRLLDLSGNRLGAESMKLLAESAACRSLLVLDLSHNPIGAAGAASLAGSPLLDELVELDVRGCELNAGSITLLKRRFGNALRSDCQVSGEARRKNEPEA